jgi:IS30 family transposase
MRSKRIEIDWKIVDELCSVQCTESEIAAHLGIHPDTLLKACKRDHKMTFEEYSRKKRKVGFISLRHKQYEKAMSGDTTMLIWLGKQYLNQADKQEQKIDANFKPVVIVDNIPKEQENG